MKVHDKKIRAFTIAEMLVVLVISSIVISLAMLVLTLIQKQLSIINTNNVQNTKIRLLERTLWQDFNKYDLFFNTKEQELVCISEIDTIKYQFNRAYVIRNTDTLNITVFKTTTYIDGDLSSDTNIDALELQLIKENSDKNLFVYKIKDASFYVNNNGI